MKIEFKNPIKTSTRGGYPAEILAIETDDVDCLIGKVTAPIGNLDVKWSASCFARDSDEALNLNYGDPAITELLDFMRKANPGTN